ncbi:MAG: 65, gp65 [Bryobacterales bacterium]|nr:65, gp65 [Bryobacterales bacterium]
MAIPAIPARDRSFNPASSKMRRACFLAGDLPPPVSATEIWLPIKAHSGYEVSNFGGVRSWRSHKSRKLNEPVLLKGAINASGYRTLNLREDGSDAPGTHLVHHLVACHWLFHTYKRGLSITHLNGNRLDNRVANLAWRSHLENMLDKRAHGTMYVGEANHFHRLTEKEVRAIRADQRSTRELASLYRVDWLTVHRVRTRESWAWVED